MNSGAPRSVLNGLVTAAQAAVFGIAVAVPAGLAVQTLYVGGRPSFQRWSGLWREGERWLELLGNTLWVGAIAAVIALGLGLLLAIITFKTVWTGRSCLYLLLLGLTCIPSYVSSTGLLAILPLELLGPGGAPLHSGLLAASAAGVIHGLVMTPFSGLLIGLGLVSVDPELEEAAMLDLGAWGVLWRVSVRRAAWSIAASGFLVILLVITDYSVTDVLQVRTFAEEIYTQYQLKGERVAPLILSLPVMGVVAAGFWALNRTAGVLSAPLFQGPRPRIRSFDLGLGGRVAAWGAMVLLACSAAAAMAEVARPIGSWSGLAQAWMAVRPEWWTTLVVALLTAPPAALAAFAAAKHLVRGPRWLRWFMGLMVIGLMSIPAPAMAMTLIEYFNQPTPQVVLTALKAVGLAGDPLAATYDSIFMYVLAIGLRLMPLAVLVCLPAIHRTPRELDQLARLEGLNGVQMLRHVYWPHAWRNVLLAALMVAILTIGELDCAHLVAPPGRATLSVRFFTLIHFGLTAEVGMVCLIAAGTAGMPALLLFALTRRRLLASHP